MNSVQYIHKEKGILINFENNNYSDLQKTVIEKILQINISSQHINQELSNKEKNVDLKLAYLIFEQIVVFHINNEKYTGFISFLRGREIANQYIDSCKIFNIFSFKILLIENLF